MLVQCLDTRPIALSPVDHDKPQSEPDEMHHAFIHLDFELYHDGDPCSMYVSRRSRIIVKFAYKSMEDIAELERQFMTEKAAYNKLQSLAGWAIPRCMENICGMAGRHSCFPTMVRPRQTLLPWISQHSDSKRSVICCGHF
jgi:hypothetical protein